MNSFFNSYCRISGVDIHRPRSEYNTAVHRSESREWSDDHDDAITSAAAGGCRRLAGGLRGQRGGGRRATDAGPGRRNAAVPRSQHAHAEEARRVRAADADRHHPRGRRAGVVLRAGAQPRAGARGYGAAALDGAVERVQRAAARRSLVRQRALLGRGLHAAVLVQVSLAASVWTMSGRCENRAQDVHKDTVNIGRVNSRVSMTDYDM